MCWYWLEICRSMFAGASRFMSRRRSRSIATMRVDSTGDIARGEGGAGRGAGPEVFAAGAAPAEGAAGRAPMGDAVLDSCSFLRARSTRLMGTSRPFQGRQPDAVIAQLEHHDAEHEQPPERDCVAYVRIAADAF